METEGTDVAPANSTYLRTEDARGYLQLGADATVGIADLVEQLHLTIARLALPLGRPRRGRTRGITGAVYRTVRGVTRVTSGGLGWSLRQLERLDRPTASTARRNALRAAINGIWGDHLAATGNPLAIPMSLQVRDREVELSKAALKAALTRPTGRIVLLVHGLCMDAACWQREGQDYGEMLAGELGYTRVALNYNSGLHVSDNGDQLAQLIDRTIENWPVPVRELVIVGHSMGGLVARAACHAAAQQSQTWLNRMTRLVFLGTPHHGAALERGGHVVDTMLQLSPYAAPFARLGMARSAGITDLRFGNIQRADWEGRHHRHQKRDDRVPTPLPAGVEAYCIAATTADRPRGLRHTWLGDGLVSLASAWGEHRDPQLALALPAHHRILVTRANHLDLLGRSEVSEALRNILQ